MSAHRPPTARILGALALWVLVVAAGSGLVWTVIATVGEDPGTDVAVPARTRPGDAGTARPGEATTSSGGRETAGPSASTTPTREPAPTRGPAPAKESDPTEAPQTSASTTPARPVTRTLSWTGEAGTVTTRCTGSRIELAGASASADGYVVEVDDRGPDRVRVEFEGRGDETVPETRVEARCVAGRPSYDVTSEG